MHSVRKNGFIRGVCHPTESFEQVKAANTEWARFDVPFPFDKDGNETESYKRFKARITRFHDNGIKVPAVTPFPDSFIRYGLDVRRKEDIPGIEKIAEFLIKDLKDICGCLQIANEIGIPRFTLPLTLKEGAEFLGICAKAMAPYKGDTLICYNSPGKPGCLRRETCGFCFVSGFVCALINPDIIKAAAIRQLVLNYRSRP